jgi:hypothetical protein
MKNGSAEKRAGKKRSFHLLILRHENLKLFLHSQLNILS